MKGSVDTAYHTWANATLFAHVQTLPEGIAEKEIEGTFSSILEVVKHMYLMDMTWLKTIDGEEFITVKASVDTEKEALRSVSFQDLVTLYESFLNKSLKKLSLEEKKSIELTHPAYGTKPWPVETILGHVINHGTYHRGNISAMLHQLGYAGVPLDYIYYLYR
ncbi:DinB family protein [Aureibacillus halotolerans]|uniref:Putative damage-inducible protein DinB n=1 Tax=Aureibacillus halotolerans TaxID=1508390 RepID=A0A4R6TUI7_9BACI|nr:DinB family protein [Aureibacillus halotolerans]TDQ36262.1 putative damage-inducible protein DinB [Aureibacillus halotolerans]